MALLPPSPIGQPPGNSFWNDWYEKLRTIVNTGAISVAFANITGKPTTLAGYGITDAGTVTDVSVATANGVSGSVATSTTTPVISLALGAITPTSVAAAGTVTGSNLSGTNTGDQTNITGNADTATALQTSRTINGVSFNGTANIVVTAAASTLTGTTLSTGVVTSSLTSLGNASNAVVSLTSPGVSSVGLQFNTNASNRYKIETPSASADLVLYSSGVTEQLRLSSGGQLSLATAGSGISVKEGVNAKMGTSTLVAGTVTVNTTAVTANSRIFLTGQNSSGTAGALTVSARVAGTSFTILSTSGTDTRSVAWIIFEPS